MISVVYLWMLNQLSDLLKGTIGIWNTQRKALIRVCERLELFLVDEVAERMLWHTDIHLSSEATEETEQVANSLCEEIVWTAQSVTLPDEFEIIEMTRKIRNHELGNTPYATVNDLLTRLEGQIRCGAYKKVRRKRRRVLINELARTKREYGVSPHLITEDPATHIADTPRFEPIEHRWWHLQREETCRFCHPKTGIDGTTVVARSKKKEDPK